MECTLCQYRRRPARGGERGGQLRSPLDPKLGVRMGKVRLNGLGGDEQGLGDLPIGKSVGGHADRAQLGGSECIGTTQRLPPRPRARYHQLLARPLGKGERPAPVRDVESPGERRASLRALAALAQPDTEVDQRSRMIEPRRRGIEPCDRLTKPLEPERTRIQRPANRSGP